MKRRKIVGVLWLLLGIAVCVTGIVVFAAVLHERYVGGVCAYYDSFAQYYWAVSKANMLASVVAGCFPGVVGIYFLCTD